MRYDCGMYGGTFNPLHQGHVRCIIEAANQCKKLIIVISHGLNRKEIPIKIRYRWVYELTNHLPHVSIMILEDTANSKEDYTKEFWMEDAKKVKDFAKQPIDVVFCGSDYDENSFWSRCYPEAKLVIQTRDGISSTAIRKNPYRYWDWMPKNVRSYYVKKVLLIGGESTGKSTLTINLANYYQTNWLEEVGRDISQRSGTDLLMIPQDFTDILLHHKVRELQCIKESNRVFFEDTDCLITKFYIQFLEDQDKERNQALADAICAFNSYDLILFLEPDVEFVMEGDRSPVIAADRLTYSEKIKEIFKEKGFRFVEIRGDYQNRFQTAVKWIDEMLGDSKREEPV